MEARNAAGRTVSLLNDAPFWPSHSIYNSYSSRSGSSSPDTPGLLRSSSFDSQMSTNFTMTPLMPSVDYISRYAGPFPQGEGSTLERPSHSDSRRSTSYEDDAATGERPAKRYPCRFRNSHGCDKTFTTSGHASRHSKIHTAEKAVQCTYPGCQKKFTRADNMKQHLETHYKDKSRSANSQRKAALAEGCRNSTSGRSRSTILVAGQDQVVTTRPKLPSMSRYPLPSPGLVRTAGWETQMPLHSRRPLIGATPRTGLDALAMAIACQGAAH